MSYQKQNFANGEVLTASQLNHIEQGIVDVESAANATKTVVDKIIDPTLSISGKAADAAKVGEAVGEIKKDLDNTIPVKLGNYKEVTGYFNAMGHIYPDANYKCLITNFLPVKN